MHSRYASVMLFVRVLYDSCTLVGGGKVRISYSLCFVYCSQRALLQCCFAFLDVLLLGWGDDLILVGLESLPCVEVLVFCGNHANGRRCGLLF